VQQLVEAQEKLVRGFLNEAKKKLPKAMTIRKAVAL
jgi:hypothetical protein